jgi:Protein of unknown function (DUF1631).
VPELVKQAKNVKVVHLEPESQRLARARIARLPAAVHAVHEKGKYLLLEKLKTFFDRADDSLFELADKANSNQEQNLFFDSMREVRVQRRGIEKRFSTAVDTAFAALASDTVAAEVDSYAADVLSADGLSLVHNDDLEQVVAVEASVTRANTQYGEAIQHISLRLDSMVPVKVYQANNPLGPEVLCRAFMEQVKKLDVDIKAKLVLFKLFDKTVVHNLSSLYGAINQLLIDQNILPSLSGVSPQQGRARGTTSSPYAGGASGSSSGVASGSYSNAGATLGAAGQRSASDQRGAPGQGGTSTSSDSQHGFLGEQVPTASQTLVPTGSEEVLQLLSLAQRAPLPVGRVDGGVAVRALLEELAQRRGSDAAFGRMDQEVINLVEMLFDFILEDRNLAAPMKALISRLQIPIIKVAIVDKAFFSKGGHAARRLLNEMATAALGWQGDAEAALNDPLYRKMDDVVRSLLDGFGTNVEIFNDLLADFSSFVEKEKRRAAVLERRTLDAEDGKAQAEIARTIIAAEVELRTVNIVVLPDVVHSLVNKAWSNVLFVTGLKHGYQSPQWESALTTLDDLVWSIEPPKTDEDRKLLIKLVPDLLKRLRAGLDSISFNPFEMSEIFRALEDIHLGCIRGLAPLPKVTRDSPQQSNPTPQSRLGDRTFNTTDSLDKSDLLDDMATDVSPETLAELMGELDDLVSGDAASNTAASKQAQTKTSRPAREVRATSGEQRANAASAVKPASAGVAASKSKPTDSSAAQGNPWDDIAADDVFMLQVGNFVQGSWFEFTDEKGAVTRCRLAAYIKPIDKFIFVNRNGMKVAEKSKQELAYLLKTSRIRALDHSMLFDRALETVVTSLRKNR